MKRTLLDIADDFAALDDLLDELDGDISGQEAAVAALFAESGAALDEKVDGYVRLIREYDARVALRKEEAKRIAALAKTDEGRAKWLKERLLFALDAMGIDKLETATHRVSVAKNGGKAPLIIDDADALGEFFFIEEVRRLDKDALRAALATRDDVDGAHIGERGRSLRIK